LTSIIGDLEHVNFYVEPIGLPISRQIIFTARVKLNVGKVLVRILSTSVEGTTPIVSLIEIPIVKLNDISLNDKLEKSREEITVSTTLESLHDPEKIRKFKEGVVC
jgi:hypothetical protein